MNTEQIAARLVELCRKGEYEQAQRELYADDAESVEMPGLPPGMPVHVRGLDAILEKGRRFGESIVEVHGSTVSDPVVARDWFSVAMGLDATFKEGGRMPMEEICVYRVRDGKIVHEQFFYSAG